ncbi:MAG: sigma-70 family RNA polymerase sigma factor [Oscillospiraceae bacterium]|nr:sigma-70 family RNA polymerase sigma factor [Oscillospiraceae bacterium]
MSIKVRGRKRANALYGELEPTITRAVSGDREALCHLCDTVARDVLYMATYLVSNPQDAEDLAQDVLYDVCKDICKLREPKAFKQWLTTITINKKNKYLTERTKRGILLDIEDYLEEFVEERNEYIPSISFENSEERKMILSLVQQLPERQREAVMLHYYSGYRVTTVAKIMDITHQNVSRYLILAREKLREDIKKHKSSEKKPVVMKFTIAPIGALLCEALKQEGMLFGVASETAELSVSSVAVTAIAGCAAGLIGLCILISPKAKNHRRSSDE